MTSEHTITPEPEDMQRPSYLEIVVARVEPECCIDTIAEAWMRLQGLKKFAADIQRELESRCVDWIVTNKSEIRWLMDESGGEMILTTKEEKSEKCRDPRKALEVLMTAGDFESVANCLSSNAWKYGAVRKYLSEIGQADIYGQLFETIVKTKLVAQDKGPDQPKLRAIDTRFINR
jgi:hypothetical protein